MVGFKIFFFFFWGSGRFQLVQLIVILVCSITLVWPLLSWPLVFLKSSFILKFWFVLLRILATIIQIIRVMLSCDYIREKENFFFFQFPLKPMPPTQSWTLVRVSAFSENFCGKEAQDGMRVSAFSEKEGKFNGQSIPTFLSLWKSKTCGAAPLENLHHRNFVEALYWLDCTIVRCCFWYID